MAAARRWTFGSAVLDERTLELTVHGSLARVERKPREVLLYLLKRAGEVVTKEELAENLWPGRILTESVLTRCISQLRQALQDDERNVIRTVHGFGYRLLAEVRVDASAAPPPPAFAFKPGDSPPLRPQWRLVERLGTGGHGEAWLARHEKTLESRVFKFALDEGTLASLKREITLYRYLHDSLGDQAAIVRVLEWNLEEAPYFTEAEYADGRDLRAWADARGGLAGISLENRLELAARIAEALAAAHSIGVLHKDLKPGNVLLQAGSDAGDPPRIKLCDFGSGGVLDAARLEALGITNLGFTKTAAEGASGTPLYLAPEIIAGQPFTVAADVYALGVVLYQIVVGDLRKALAPGWELNVDDELLREDIALAAAGDPARRLADAAQLATRLRSLEVRRHARAVETAARERAERTRRVLQELRRTRAAAAAVFVLAVAAVVGGVTAYRARNEAVAARATTQAVNDFLVDDVLSVDPSIERPKDASYESLLNRAAAHVDLRFKDQPEAAVSVHWLLGRRFHELGRVDLAWPQYEKAGALLDEVQGRAVVPALLALDRLVSIYMERGRTADMIATAKKLLRNWIARFGPTNMSTLLLRARIARTFAYAGEVMKAETEIGSILTELPQATPPSEEAKTILKEWLGLALTIDTSNLRTEAQINEAITTYIGAIHAGFLVEFADNSVDGESRFRELLPSMSRLFGDNSENTASLRLSLAVALAMNRRQDEAQEQMSRAEEFFDSSVPPRHWIHAVVGLLKGRLFLEQQRPEEALAELDRAMALCAEAGCSLRIAEDVNYDIGRSNELLGDLDHSIDIYRKSLSVLEPFRGPNHYACLRRRLGLADALRRTGRFSEATDVLSGVAPEALAALPSEHLIRADFLRVQGLLWIDKRQSAKGRAPLQESLAIVEHQLGSGHWRTDRARVELAQAVAH